ncbi:ABC transporter substrate-binding protein [Pseudomonas prosekii]|uniref:ABC transporter substrate-binding protein n=1 Tax=Pseudomonas prosekii TaxID=1148509 RepID=UPI0011EAEFDE|nr:ABC transporter substrate-binding protein [Pseudomonas prosekii]
MRRLKIVVASALAFSSGLAFAADITVASHVANIPFEFEDQNGKVVGYEVDIINEVAKQLGKTIEYTSMPFHMLFPAVQSGRADIAIGTVTITSKRLESVAFSQPWIDSEQCLTVATNAGIEGLEGLGGKPLAVQTGTVGEIWATNNQEQYKFSDIRRYDGNVDALLDVAAGRVSGLVHDCPMDAYYIKDKPQYKIVARIPTNEQFAAMFSKDSKLIAAFNEQITKLKEKGEIDRIHKKWFGESAGAESSVVKTMPIPKLTASVE